MSTIETSANDSLRTRAYYELRDQIVSGRLKQGQRLSLRGVAGALGISMVPVGEAFRELARDGLLEMEPGWGTRVRKISGESLRSQHILRSAIECEAARQCCSTATDLQLAELLQLATELDQRIDTESPPDQIRGLDSQFHLRIAELSGAASLVEVLKANQLVRMVALGSVLAHHRPKPALQHVVIVVAIQSRDPVQAEQVMREHCQRSMQLQLAAFGQGIDASMSKADGVASRSP